MSVAEQRYQAVLAVISEGRAVMEVASRLGVSRRAVHRWLARYEVEGLEGLPDRSHRPARCPHQTPAEIEVRVLEIVGRTGIGARGAWPWSWRARRSRHRRSRRCTGVWCAPA